MLSERRTGWAGTAKGQKANPGQDRRKEKYKKDCFYTSEARNLLKTKGRALQDAQNEPDFERKNEP
jgi:hypothetical protein